MKISRGNKFRNTCKTSGSGWEGKVEEESLSKECEEKKPTVASSQGQTSASRPMDVGTRKRGQVQTCSLASNVRGEVRKMYWVGGLRGEGNPQLIVLKPFKKKKRRQEGKKGPPGFTTQKKPKARQGVDGFLKQANTKQRDGVVEECLHDSRPWDQRGKGGRKKRGLCRKSKRIRIDGDEVPQLRSDFKELKRKGREIVLP